MASKGGNAGDPGPISDSSADPFPQGAAERGTAPAGDGREAWERVSGAALSLRNAPLRCTPNRPSGSFWFVGAESGVASPRYGVAFGHHQCKKYSYAVQSRYRHGPRQTQGGVEVAVPKPAQPED